jgi:AbrB family looped-hinge helix DNA binding protein
MAATTPIVEFLATTSIGEKGQLTVPKKFRDDLGLKPGAPVTVLRMGDGLILIPEQGRVDRICDAIGGALRSAGATPESIVKSLEKTRQELFDEWYGDVKPKPAAKRRSAERRAR